MTAEAQQQLTATKANAAAVSGGLGSLGAAFLNLFIPWRWLLCLPQALGQPEDWVCQVGNGDVLAAQAVFAALFVAIVARVSTYRAPANVPKPITT